MDCECLALCPEYSTCPINVRTLPLTSSLPRANFMSVRPVEPNRAHCSEGSQALSFMFCCHHLAICNTFSTRCPPIFPFYTGLSRLCSQPAYLSIFTFSSLFQTTWIWRTKHSLGCPGWSTPLVAHKVFRWPEWCSWLNSTVPALA